ncbi:MAG: hypothetical protein JRN27_03870 [Nitrososphaerota archaeon]|nr:hypothetical protein [Nitrososphaerota archaeon]
MTQMEGVTIGVFGSDAETKSAFAASVAKKSEAEGMAVYTRTEGGRCYSLLDATDFPEKVQGYSRIASMVDHALYLYPKSGRLTAPDGELALLVAAFGLSGTLEVFDGSSTPEAARSSLRGTAVAGFDVEERQISSAAIDLGRASPRGDFLRSGALIYMDRAFTVKGVGTVALGFVLSGEVSIHDQLRLVPGAAGLRADVKGIQVNDVDFDSAGRGIRVGLSLRGVEPKDLDRCHWLDDGSLTLADEVTFDFVKSSFYKPEVAPRDLHLQLPGEMAPARITAAGGPRLRAKLPWPVPVWDGMRAAVIDLNGGALRVAGGATCKL